MIVGIMDDGDVDSVQSETAQAFFEAPPDAVGREIEYSAPLSLHRESLCIWRSRAVGVRQQPPHLGRDHILGAWSVRGPLPVKAILSRAAW